MLSRIALATVVLLSTAAAWQSLKDQPPTPPPSASADYVASCAACHGKDAKGNGPAAAALKVPPPDLTTLARKNHGLFPKTRVYQIIVHGGSMAAHGSKDMPMWGPAFRSTDRQDQTAAEARVRKLVDYLETLQVK